MKKSNKGITILKVLVSVAAPLLLLAFWQISATNGNVSAAILPSFTKVLQTFGKMISNGKLWGHLSVSILRVIKGFSLGAVAGITIGILMGLSPWVNRFLGSLVSILRPIPMIAWIPIFILWMGIGEGTKVTLIMLGTFWSVLLNTIHGIQTVDKKLLEVAKVLKKNKLIVITRVIIPSALPAIFTGIRLGMGVAWSCVVAAEMIAASKGIGFMITYAREVSKPTEVFVGVIVIGVIGLIIDKALQALEKKILKWI